MESQLKQLWAEVLDRNETDISDDADFFSIGGDSVAAIALAGVAHSKGILLVAQDIFEHPGLKDMAKAVESAKEASDSDEPNAGQQKQDLNGAWDIINHCLTQCEIEGDDLDYILPCTPYQAELMRAGHELGAWTFQAVFEVAEQSLERAKQAMDTIRERTPAFRTRVVQHESGLYQVVTKDPTWWNEMEGEVVKIRDRQGAKRACYGQPLSNYGVARNSGKAYIIWTMTHTIYDRWSKVGSLEDIRECFLDPDTFNRKPTRPPFRDFVDHISGQDSEKSIKFWKDQLQGLKTHEYIFRDQSVGERQYLTSKTAHRKVIPYRTISGTSIGFDAIAQTAWSLVLANDSKSSDIFYCALRSCRHMAVPGVRDILGPLWSLVPARRKIKGDQTLQQLLKTVYDATISGISHEPWGVRAMDQHFGHKRYLQNVILPQPPQPDFGATVSTRDADGREHWLRSADELWVQTRGHFGLYYMLTPKMNGDLEIWARYDEHFINDERVAELTERYAEMLEKIWEGNWEKIKVDELCPHLSSSSKPNAKNSLDRDAEEGTPKTLTHLFRSKQPDDEALIIPGKQDFVLSHAHLHKAVGDLQKRLAELGIKKDSAVSIALPNSAELIAVFLATTWQKGIAAPLNPAYKEDEFAFYIDDLGSALVVIPQGAFEKDGAAIQAAKKYKAALAECFWDGEKFVMDVKDDGKLKDAPQQEILEAAEDDVALVLHTSGTTGRPKAVPLTHANLMSNIANICRTYSLTPSDRTMLIMPLFHVHGLLASFLSPLYSGGSAIVPPRLQPDFWSLFTKHSASWYSATPSMHRLILQFPPPAPLPHIRFIRSCSSQLPVALYEELADKFHTQIVESYAMTEASHLMASNPLDEGKQKPGSVGIPHGVEMCLLDAEGNEVEEGEVSIRGPNVTHGYLNNAEANKKEFTDSGFFRTGDQGKFDEDGYLFLTGRLKEMINKGGEKISPVELDNVISQHEEVAEVVCFAIEDEAYGQDVGCAIKKKDGAKVDERELKKWIGERLTGAKVPKKIWFCEEIPKTATGKVQRRLVAEAMAKS